MPDILLALLACAGVLLAVTFWLAARPLRSPIVFHYPNGVQLVGSGRPGKVRVDIVQWLGDPGRGSNCPLVVHLPHGDLGGKELAHWEAPVKALKLGAHADVDISPVYGPSGNIGDVVGVRVGLIPVGSPIEISINGMRVQLPLSEADALTLLGEPKGRVILLP